MTRALAVVVKSIRNVMELSSDFVQVIQDIVLKPDLTGAVIVLVFSFLNELVAILPYIVLVSGQLLFVEPSSFPIMLPKLFFLVAVPAGIGGAIGSLFIYGLAYFGGKPAIEKFKKFLRFSWEDVDKVNRYFKGTWYDELIFLAWRSIPILPPLPINVLAGVMRMNPVRYFVLTALGFTARIMIMLGFMWFVAGALAL